MSFSNVRPCRDNRPDLILSVYFRFGRQPELWSPAVPGDFWERDADERAVVLDECLAEWAEGSGYVVERCSWELLTELPEGLEEAEEATGGSEGSSQLRWQGR